MKIAEFKYGIYLSVKDLMILTGSVNYKSVAKSHKAIRDSIAVGKRKLTISEYCQYEGLDAQEITRYLRGKPR